MSFPSVNGWADRAEQACRSLEQTATALERVYERTDLFASSPQYRVWESFTDTAGVVCSSNAGTFNFKQVRPGFEVLVQRLAISISGASSGATAAIYVATGTASGTLSELDLVDYASSFLGSSPSRQIADFHQPVWMTAGQHIVIVVASTGDATSQVYARMQGVRREVQAQMVPAS